MAIVSHYNILDHFYKAGDINGDFNWLVIYYFHELVNNHQDWVISFTFLISRNLKPGIKIHGQVFPSIGQKRKELHIMIAFMLHWFLGQTYITSFGVRLNIDYEHWPIIFSSYQFLSLFNAKVACQKIVIVPAY